jgi:hypothetical protein
MKDYITQLPIYINNDLHQLQAAERNIEVIHVSHVCNVRSNASVMILQSSLRSSVSSSPFGKHNTRGASRDCLEF